MSPLALLCLAPLLVFVVLFVRFRCSRYHRLISEIPGPRGLPLIGQLLTVMASTDRLMDFLKELCQVYGFTGAGWIGPYAFVCLGEPGDLEILLNKNECLSKPVTYKPLELCFGYSAITACRADWKRYRKLMHPSFSTQTLETFVPAFNKKGETLSRVLEKRAGGEEFDVLTTMMLCTLDIVTETSLGADMDLLEQNKVELADSFDVARELLYFTVLRPWYWIPAFSKRTSTYKKMASGLKALWDFTDDVIVRKLSLSEEADAGVREDEARDLECEPSPRKKRMGFIDHVISCMRQQSDLLTRTELKDNTFTVIIGGMDTSSIAMSALLMLLGLHRDVQEKIVDELRDVFDDDVRREATADDLGRMAYLEQVINETLRLYPPLPAVMREVEDEVKLTKYTLPKGCVVVIPMYLVHRNPEYFPDPDRFDPDRFNVENSANRHPYSFIPFLSGKRMCIGKKYAYMQMKTLLSTLLRKYEVLPSCTREEMERVQFKLTLNFINGCKVKLTPRIWERNNSNNAA
ncbi:cytochrome P450 4C1-like [Bacillus rossius redtenbacheri]|uniref:cytochrome P450 4C1-like n=1 Tax=Bacillus rossius redtenbacheri TaxID=93214 RepID=UPI002FDDDD80